MDIFTADDSATPLTEDEIEGLIPSYIADRSELNEAEQANILEAQLWAMGRTHPNILTEGFIRNLHRRMFQNVWQWAGKPRKTARNIGVDAWKIPEELQMLLADTQCWIENSTYPPDEIAARFHHRLVWIHPFPNGNGRMARLMTDILLRHLGRPRFTWGQENLVEISEARQAYISALRAADERNIQPLLEFVRS